MSIKARNQPAKSYKRALGCVFSDLTYREMPLFPPEKGEKWDVPSLLHRHPNPSLFIMLAQSSH